MKRVNRIRLEVKKNNHGKGLAFIHTKDNKICLHSANWKFEKYYKTYDEAIECSSIFETVHIFYEDFEETPPLETVENYLKRMGLSTF